MAKRILTEEPNLHMEHIVNALIRSGSYDNTHEKLK